MRLEKMLKDDRLNSQRQPRKKLHISGIFPTRGTNSVFDEGASTNVLNKPHVVVGQITLSPGVD